MKSILIITEQFTLGGLETHICGEITTLSKLGVGVYLATGKKFNGALLPINFHNITHGIPLGSDSSSEDLLYSISELRQIIRTNSIDFVHIHPFTSIIPGAIAAELENIPFSITFHGPASLAEYYGPVHDFLVKSLILPIADLVVAVSTETEKLLLNYADKDSIVVIPNSVNFEPLLNIETKKIELNPHWLIASRLDNFKIVGVLDFCIKAKLAGISNVLVAGDGPAKEDLSRMLSEHGLDGYVTLLGASSDMNALMRNASGVAGMGRVLLEAIALKKPFVLVGYDGVKGVVDPELLTRATDENFSGRGLPTINIETLSEQLQTKVTDINTLKVYSLAEIKFNNLPNWSNFLNQLHPLSRSKSTALIGLYNSISLNLIDLKTPYLYSEDLLNKLQAFVSGKKHFEPRLAHALTLTRQRLQSEFIKKTSLERDGQIINLNQSLTERDGQIINLNRSLAERDEKLIFFEAYQTDKEIYIAQLIFNQNKRDKEERIMNSKILNKIKRIPYYTHKSVGLIKNRGFSGFAKALSNKITRSDQPVSTSYVQPPAQQDTFIAIQNVSNFSTALLGDELVIITGVPFDDVGGGQRAAQLARCALKTGRNVVYVYIYQKFDFETNRHVESNINIQGLTHLHIEKTSPTQLLQCITSRATVIFEFPHPAAINYLRLFNARGIRTVFELIDDWETSLGGDWFNIEVYRQFVAEAQHVVGTAKLLVNRLENLDRADALYLPNAANEYIFDKYKKYSKPNDLPTGRRVGLYFGSLYGEWFAWDYLQEAATRNADINFVLIGDRPNGKIMPANVHMIGAKMIDELPGYLVHSDFCIIPFAPGQISDAVSPIKIFEYLFSGKPVVSTHMPEVIGYPGVSIANSPEEFASLCASIEISEAQIRDNDQFISRNSWFSRLDSLVGTGKTQYFDRTVSAIILIHNNKNIIGRCLETLLQHCSAYLKEVIVIDNASNDGGAEYVETNFPTVKVLRNPVNGCSSGRNLGVASATGKYLAFFDSDQWFTSSSCFAEALTILERDANVGAIGWGAGWFDPHDANLGGMIADYCPNRAMNQTAITKGYRSDIGYLGTCGFFTPKTIFDATAGFDVGFDPTCFEDTDLSFQIKLIGFDICYRDLTGIRHQPHQTTGANTGSIAYTTKFNKNATYFKKKWADYPHFFTDYQS